MPSKIIPNLWFDDQAEQAVNFYISVFKNSRILNIMRYGPSGSKVSGKPEGSIMTIAFQLDGQDFVAINGGSEFKFSEAVSFLIDCPTQEEIDYFWSRLTEGGQEGPCGWLKDKFGLSWQVAPALLDEMLRDPDPKKSENVMKAMLEMTKIDIAKLKQAFKT